MIYMKKLIRTIKYPDNKGNTMFETIVAFFVLTIILMLIYQMIAFCGQLRMKATDTSQVINAFNRDMYKDSIKTDGSLTGKTTVGSIEVTPRSTVAGDQGPLFYLALSSDTKDANLKTNSVSDFVVNDTQAQIASSYRIRMDSLHANSLVSVDNRIEEEQLVTPKVVQFYYKH